MDRADDCDDEGRDSPEERVGVVAGEEVDASGWLFSTRLGARGSTGAAGFVAEEVRSEKDALPTPFNALKEANWSRVRRACA